MASAAVTNGPCCHDHHAARTGRFTSGSCLTKGCWALSSLSSCCPSGSKLRASSSTGEMNLPTEAQCCYCITYLSKFAAMEVNDLHFLKCKSQDCVGEIRIILRAVSCQKSVFSDRLPTRIPVPISPTQSW